MPVPMPSVEVGDRFEDHEREGAVIEVADGRARVEWRDRPKTTRRTWVAIPNLVRRYTKVGSAGDVARRLAEAERELAKLRGSGSRWSSDWPTKDGMYWTAWPVREPSPWGPEEPRLQAESGPWRLRLVHLHHAQLETPTAYFGVTYIVPGKHHALLWNHLQVESPTGPSAQLELSTEP